MFHVQDSLDIAHMEHMGGNFDIGHTVDIGTFDFVSERSGRQLDCQVVGILNAWVDMGLAFDLVKRLIEVVTIKFCLMVQVVGIMKIRLQGFSSNIQAIRITCRAVEAFLFFLLNTLPYYY